MPDPSPPRFTRLARLIATHNHERTAREDHGHTRTRTFISHAKYTSSPPVVEKQENPLQKVRTFYCQNAGHVLDRRGSVWLQRISLPRARITARNLFIASSLIDHVHELQSPGFGQHLFSRRYPCSRWQFLKCEELGVDLFATLCFRDCQPEMFRNFAGYTTLFW